MADPFTRCQSVNKAGFHCWLARNHRGGIHETHPAERGRSREAGASPVWSDPDLVPTCRSCGAPIGRDRDGRWAATHPGDDAPWSCPVNAGGHAPFEREADR